MGRLDVVIPDQLENDLRIEIIKRYGGRKGDLSKAIIEAIEMWVKTSIVDELEKTATNQLLSHEERLKATKMLGKSGKSALSSLNKIANNLFWLREQRETALDEIERILKN